MNKTQELLNLVESVIMYKGHQISAGQDPRTGGFAPKIDTKIYDYGCDHSQEAIDAAKSIIDGKIKNMSVQKGPFLKK